jgi:glycosyltransferase involved in cell wall biosynthesis
VVVWFGTPGYGSLVSAACQAVGAPYLLISGGAEVARRDALGFGDARRPLRRTLVARVIRGARVVWAFSESARAEVEALAQPAMLRVVPPAVDTSFFRPLATARTAQVVTACWTISRLTIRQKGLDRLLELARRRPQVSFVVVGHAQDADERVRAFVGGAPPNVTFPGFVTRDALRHLYASSRVYAQLSQHEGFGVAVAEAMAMGCTPLVADEPSLRAIVGDGGPVVGHDASVDVALQALDQALAGSYAADRWSEIDRRFGPAVRRQAWIDELGHLGLV